jgi:hypothetical protein
MRSEASLPLGRMVKAYGADDVLQLLPGSSSRFRQNEWA